MSGLQQSLFDVPRETASPYRHLDRDGLASVALLYTATEKGNHSGVRFGMSLEDARAWCSSDVSRGAKYSTEWAYFWTTALSFVDAYWTRDEPVFDFSRDYDSGEWDERIAALGLTKLGFDELARVLGPMGVKVLVPGTGWRT